MSFVFPQFLWAMGLIAIPIIIHLFNFRKFTPIHFSNVQFLKEVKEETKRRSTLKHLLILACRILAIAALVLAFAQPYISNETKTEKNNRQLVSIYVDNSFSMDSEGEDGRFIDMARQIAIEIAEKYDDATQFHLITNEMGGQQQRLVNKQGFIEQCTDIDIRPQSRSVGDIVKWQADIFNKHKEYTHKAIMISDFQKSMFSEEATLDTLEQLTAIHIQSKSRNNLYIDSLWFETPLRKVNEIEVLKVRVGNFSDSSTSVKLNLDIDEAKYSTKVSIPADTLAIAELKFTNKRSGDIAANIHLSSPRQMKYDDTLFFSYHVLSKINVLEIGVSESKTFYNILGQDDLIDFTYVSSGNVDVSTINNYQLIVLNGLNQISGGLAKQLENFVKSGGSLTVFPGNQLNYGNFNSFLSSLGVNNYNNLYSGSIGFKSYKKGHVFFDNLFERDNKDVSLPKANKHYTIDGTYSSKEAVLFDLFNGASALSYFPVESGKVYLSAIALDESFGGFKKHWTFVTSVLRMAELSFPSKPLYYVIGSNQYPNIADRAYNKELNFEIRKGNDAIIPISDRSKAGVVTLIDSYGQEGSSMMKEDGIYELRYDNKLIENLSYNFNRKESEMAFVEGKSELTDLLNSYNIGQLNVQEASQIDEVVKAINSDDNQYFWRHCLIAALVFLGLEILLIRLWKN